MELSELALIGNCQIAAHVDRDGAIVWCCLPRFDAPPVFGSLLDPDGGSFLVGPASGVHGRQRYLPNTNVLETTFVDDAGSFRVVDFAPRFSLFDRPFRPAKIVRIVEPLGGTPRIRVACRPVLGWSKARPSLEHGSHHVTFRGYPSELRLTTDAPLSYLDGEAFALTSRRHFVLAWGAPVEEALEPLCDRFLRETSRYWQRWVKHCSIPAHYQEQVIRSALALKLHCFEDTGAIVAALTTSLPEAEGSGRNWDYRYCWLRDASYALGAFHLLGQFEEREQFIHYLLNVASSAKDLDLAPLYRIDGRSDLDEEVVPGWAGFAAQGPVRIGNGAALHKQHDVFGEMVLALAPVFFDARFRDQVTPAVTDLLESLARRAVAVVGKPDAGIWETRAKWRPQTFSAAMCWAAADRGATIAERHRPAIAAELRDAATRIHGQILERAVRADGGTLTADFDGHEVDAALLQALRLGVFRRGDPRIGATIDAIRRDLSIGGWLKRYRTDDGLGTPSVAFTLCTFWLVEVLAMFGRVDEARELMKRVDDIHAPLGLLSEDLDPATGRMWGNHPQAYSHVGLIHAAFAASPAWSEIAT